MDIRSEVCGRTETLLQLRTVSGGVASWNATTVVVSRSRRRVRTIRSPPGRSLHLFDCPQVDLVPLEITMSCNLLCSRFERLYMSVK